MGNLFSIKLIALYLCKCYFDINFWLLKFNLTGKYFGRPTIPSKMTNLKIIMTKFNAYHALFMQYFNSDVLPICCISWIAWLCTRRKSSLPDVWQSKSLLVVYHWCLASTEHTYSIKMKNILMLLKYNLKNNNKKTKRIKLFIFFI